MPVTRIWIAIRGKTLEIFEDGTLKLILEKERHPDKEFIEIEKVYGDIGKLVDLAINSYIEEIARKVRLNLDRMEAP